MSRKRLVLLAYDALSLTLVVLVFSLAPIQKAYAYVDPSVMTYTIQALAGVAVALSAVLGVALRRTRKALMKFLNIDENARKEVEPDVHRIDSKGSIIPNAGEEGASVKRLSNQTQHGNEQPRKLKQSRDNAKYHQKWAEKLVVSLVIGGFFAYTLFFVGPCEVSASSDGSLIYGLKIIWPIMAKGTLLITLFVVLFLSITRGRVFNIAVLLLFSLGLGFYLQAMFMNSGLSVANGATVKWQDYSTITALSSLVWLAVILLPLIASFHKPRLTQIAACGLSAALVVVQTAGVISLLSPDDIEASTDKSSQPATEYVLTKNGMFDLSTKNNIIVFTLDTFDTKFLMDSYAAHPQMLDELTGFTWFQNSVGSMIPTRYGNPFLFTGQIPEKNESFQNFLGDRFRRSSYLCDIENAGYSIGIYTDTLGTENLPDDEAESLVYDKLINASPVDENTAIDDVGVFKALTQCAAYRDFPWLCKPFIWFYTDQINQTMRGETSDITQDPFVMDDALWYQELQNIGISLNDDGEKGAFRYIHLMGTHWPYSLDEQGNYVGVNEVTLDQQAQASILMVSEYLRQLKQAGLYDEATIIITADHGDYYPIETPLEEPTSPILLVKPAQTEDEALAPLVVSNAPVWAGDILPTIIKAVGGDSSSYGKTVFDISESAFRPRYYLQTVNDKDGMDVLLLQYEINGDVLDFDSWTLTGESWDVWG